MFDLYLKCMLYPITRPLAKITLSVFFRKIYFSNSERVARDKPVILAANHPTAFLEPCILACWLDQPIHFLVRGDVFEKSWANWMLRDLHMIPIYRKKDGGFRKLRRNFDTLEEAVGVLGQARPLLVMAEGGTNGSRCLSPLQKGVARLAFMTQEAYPGLEVEVVPVGVNYSKLVGFREQVAIDFGEPMKVRDFMPDYLENPNKGIRLLTQALKEHLEEHLVQIQPAREATTEYLLEMQRNQARMAFWPFSSGDDQPLRQARTLANRVQALSDNRFEALQAGLGQYQRILQENRVSDLGIGQVGQLSGLWMVPLLLLALPGALGWLVHLPPALMAGAIANKKVKRQEYWSSIVAGTGMLFFLLYYLVILLFSLVILGLKGLIFVLSLPVLGLIHLWWSGTWKRWVAVRRFFVLPEAVRHLLFQHRSELLELKEQRQFV